MSTRLAATLVALLTATAAGAQPANDDCANATPIGALPFVDTVGDIASATLEVGEPGSTCSSTGNQSVWYRFAAAGPVLLDVDTAGSDCATDLHAYTGACGAFSELSCSPVNQDGLSGDGTDSERARMIVTLSAGEEAFIRVRWASCGAGDLVVTVTETSVLQASAIEEDALMPSVGANGLGDFLVAWWQTGPTNHVRGRLVDASGRPKTPSFQISTSDPAWWGPAIAGADDGSFVVAWHSYAGGSDVLAQRVDSNGNLVGGEIAVADVVAEAGGGANFPEVATLPAGRFIVAWPGDAGTVRARTFDATGTAEAPSFQIASNDNYRPHPSLAAAPDGSFIVSWVDDYEAIMARRYDAASSPLGGAFQVNVVTTGSVGRRGPDVSIDDDGNFVVVWEGVFSGQYPGFVSNVLGRRYDASGTPFGGEFRVNTSTLTYGPESTYGDDYMYQPTVGSSAGGEFVVAWTRAYAGPYARRFDDTGTAIDPAEFRVTHINDDYQYSTNLAADAQGSFVVVWHHASSSDYRILGRGFPAPPDVGVTGKKLVIVDKLAAAGKAKTVFVSKDANVTKGAGTDVAGIDVELTVAYADGSTAGAFVLPAGASDGTSGWKVNKSTVAKYVNKSAPAGPTQAKVGVLKPGKLLKLVGKGLGDTPIDIFTAGPPTSQPVGQVVTSYCVSNGDGEFCHCTAFSECSYKLIAADTGAKLVCKDGVPDADCTAVGGP